MRIAKHDTSINSTVVIGSTGMTGRRLVPKLAARGVTVRATSRKPTANQVLFDWSNPETYDAALRGTDSVFLITSTMVEDPSDMVSTLLDHAKESGVRRIVLLASMGLEFSHENGTSGRHKVESVIKESPFEWVVLRSGGFAQNFSESFLLPGILHANMIATATGNGATAFVDVEDIAEVAALAMLQTEMAGSTFTLTGPSALTFGEAARQISQVAERTILYNPLSAEEFLEVLRGAGVPADFASVLVKDQEAIRAGEGARVSEDIPKLLNREARGFKSFVTDAKNAWAQKQSTSS